jgi:hypothetical protein
MMILIIVLIYHINGTNDFKLPQNNDERGFSMSNLNIIPLEPLDYFTAEFRGRDLFQTTNVIPKSDDKNIDYVESGKLLNNLILLGIISSDNPKAIIKDRALDRALQVGIGDSICGFLIMEINKTDVILADSLTSYVLKM